MSAMRPLVLMLLFLCVISSITAINLAKVDLKCTIECAGFWLATVRNGNARYPSGCECSKFAI
uniref:AAI domain-containing protein n=1 Tax=Ascaris lumbricoides TaxID=6252 RepID=A0A0M3HYC2_ASCLU